MKHERSPRAKPISKEAPAACGRRSRPRGRAAETEAQAKDDHLIIEIYPAGISGADQMGRSIQETMEEEGVKGLVFTRWTVPEVLARCGITRLPALRINGRVVVQGRVPERADLVRCFDELVPRDRRVPGCRPRRKGWPSSLDEAVAWLLERMDEQDKRALASADDEFLVMLHLGLGTAIRNGFGLWAGNDSLLRDCGTADADAASQVIIRAARDRLRKEGYK